MKMTGLSMPGEGPAEANAGRQEGPAHTGLDGVRVSIQQFLGLGTIDTLGWIRFCSGWSICPMHCKVFNNTSSFYPLEASSAPSHL